MTTNALLHTTLLAGAAALLGSAQTAARSDTIIFSGMPVLQSFHSDGLYNLVGLGTWNGSPVSNTNMPSDAQRDLQADINLFVQSDAANVLYVRLTNVSTTTGAWWMGTAFVDVTQTGIELSLPMSDGSTTPTPAFSSNFANPDETLASGSPNEVDTPLTNTPGYTFSRIDRSTFLIQTVDNVNATDGFTSLGNITNATRIRGGGVFQLTFPASTNLLQDLDLLAIAEMSQYGSGNQYISGVPVPEPATLTLFGSALLGLGVVYLRRRLAKV